MQTRFFSSRCPVRIPATRDHADAMLPKFQILPILAMLLSLQVSTAGCLKGGETAEGPQPTPSTEAVAPEETTRQSAPAVYPTPELYSQFELGGARLETIGANLDVGISSARNSFYSVNGARVQVNDLVPKNANQLIGLYTALFSQVGQMNAVLLEADGVCELISSDPYASEAVRATLDLAPLQGIKLTPHSAFGEALVVRDEAIVGDNLDRICSDLDIDLEALVNQELSIDGESVRVNFLRPSAGTTALQAMNKLAWFKGSDSGLYVLGDIVIEVVTSDVRLAETVWRLVNVPPPSPAGPYRYQVRFTAIPISHADYMKLNDCSLLASNGATREELLEADPSLIFGGLLPLFTNRGRTRIEWTPEGRIVQVDDSITQVTLPAQDSLSAVEATMTAHIGGPIDVGPAELSPYIEETPFWPTGSERVRDALREALMQMEGDGTMAMVSAIAGWVRENITYSDGPVGSRFGVEQVLEQGYGRCWDQSDVFITLARAAGLPARQVDGWIYGLGGHVWSQVWIHDEHIWLDVDTTTDKLGVDSYYIPMWGTRDGEMLFLYRDWPRVTRFGR
jgi:transglutaminase-like putative cysteine protease